MADDIAPELLNAVRKQFLNAFYADPTVRSILPKVYDKKATYGELNTLAKRAGELCGEALTANLTANVLPDGKLYYNIADKVVGELLRRIHADVDGYAQKVQEGLNSRANIGLKPQHVPVDNDRINGIVNAASHTETLEAAHDIIERSTANYAQHVVDEAVRVNARFQYNAGLEPKVSRRTNGKCCEWCNRLAGVFDYEDVFETGSDVWRRHLDCDCVIEYDPGTGRSEKVSNYRARKDQKPKKLEELKKRRIEARWSDDRKGVRNIQGLPDDRASDKIAVRKAIIGIDNKNLNPYAVGINTRRLSYRKISLKGEVLNPMSADDYYRISKALQKQGVEVFAATSGDDLRYMMYIGAEGTYSNGRITHIGEIPSRGTLFEEIIHMAQSRKYGELNSTDPIELTAREVAANRKLLKNQRAYRLDYSDIADIEENLNKWENDFYSLTGVHYDESGIRRDI